MEGFGWWLVLLLGACLGLLTFLVTSRRLLECVPSTDYPAIGEIHGLSTVWGATVWVAIMFFFEVLYNGTCW